VTTRVKICCMASEEEASIAVAFGASAVGLVSAMPSGPGPIPDERIATIARTVPAAVHTFLLTSLRSPAQIAEHHRRVDTTAVQIVDRLTGGSHVDLRARLPGVALVQVVHVTGPEAVEEAQRIAPFVDALLLDSGRPDLPVKELGGTGRCHDWSISRRIREVVSVPVFLAGGLRPDNVREAIETVSPFGVDVCSGVRTAGRLDREKVEAFMRAVGVLLKPVTRRMTLRREVEG
jgi:phosphoribosylanthranilate isomerase